MLGIQPYLKKCCALKCVFLSSKWNDVSAAGNAGVHIDVFSSNSSRQMLAYSQPAGTYLLYVMKFILKKNITCDQVGRSSLSSVCTTLIERSVLLASFFLLPETRAERRDVRREQSRQQALNKMKHLRLVWDELSSTREYPIAIRGGIKNNNIILWRWTWWTPSVSVTIHTVKVLYHNSIYRSLKLCKKHLMLLCF